MFEGALWRGVLASLLLGIGVFGLAVESLRSLQAVAPARRGGARRRLRRSGGDRPLGYREPSLVFLTGTDLAMAPDRGARLPTSWTQPGCRIAFVERRFAGGFPGGDRAGRRRSRAC